MKELLKNYFVVIKIDEFGTNSENRFYKLLMSEYQWSIQLLDDILIIQTKDSIFEIRQVIYDLAERMEQSKDFQLNLFYDKIYEYPSRFDIKNLFICELGNHWIDLMDYEKSKYLSLLLSNKK